MEILINIPVGLACAAICWTNLKSRELKTRKVPVDTTGFVLLVIWVGALQIMLDTGKDAGWFSSTAIIVEGLIAIIGFIVWVIWEVTAEHPIVDLSLFRNKNFAIGTAILCVAYGLFFTTALLTPLWLQILDGLSRNLGWPGQRAGWPCRGSADAVCHQAGRKSRSALVGDKFNSCLRRILLYALAIWSRCKFRRIGDPKSGSRYRT